MVKEKHPSWFKSEVGASGTDQTAFSGNRSKRFIGVLGLLRDWREAGRSLTH